MPHPNTPVYLHLRPAFGSALTLLVTAFAVLMRHVFWTWMQASDLISAMTDRRSIILMAITSMRWADHLGEIASLSSCRRPLGQSSDPFSRARNLLRTGKLRIGRLHALNTLQATWNTPPTSRAAALWVAQGRRVSSLQHDHEHDPKKVCTLPPPLPI